ncbi:MAG: ATP synthase F1 subunit gamma [Ignavibacteria bacterium]|nr:ATP synthase F1 subunit gamma [Ignavibacteria bacterium]MBK9228445.1 ATP synthase F1 subunit gamma [Ignavibacteria bacterium]
MATLKELKVRITGIKGTQKITRAMKMVASAKLRRAQDKIISARPYAKKINELLTDLVSVAGEGVDELLDQREIKKRCVVVVSADRGLAGSFNTNIIRYGLTYANELGKTAKVVVVGKKANDSLRKKDLNIIKSYTGIFNELSIEQSNDIVSFLVDGYRRKDFDCVEIIYNEFKSIAKQVTVKEQFLPLKRSVKDVTVKTEQTGDYIYEPEKVEIIKELIPKQLRVQFWKVLLESNAAEQAARMTAMETATKNASDLLTELELSYNQARQASITKEILEIVGGAEALKDA